MRILAAFLVLAGCEANPSQHEAAGEGGPLACALAGSDRFARTCRVARTALGEGSMLTLTAPDGGFRKVVVSADGGNIAVADGAEPALVTRTSDGGIEIAIGEDRYRLPAAGE